MDVLQFAKKIVNTKPETLLKKVINAPKFQTFTENLITEDQLRRRNEDGNNVKLADNDPFGGYSPATASEKGVGIRQVNLFDTGAYYASVEVYASSNGDFVTASNPTIHGNNLKDRWGKDIDKLNPENKEKAHALLEKEFINEIKLL